WGTPNMIEDGLQPDLLLAGKYGHQMHVWDLRRRRHVQALDLGNEQQMVLEMRPAHNPTKAYGFVGVVVSLKDLSASIWLWHRNNGTWDVKKVIEIPAEPADPAKLPPMLKDFKAVPPLVTDINLSLDDKFLYVSCWGTGEFLQYDVSDPFNPRKTGSVRIGGIVDRAPHPKNPKEPLAGGPQMVEASGEGKRICFTNCFFAAAGEKCYARGGRSPGSRDPPRRRRFLERFFPFSVNGLWPWLTLFGLGAFHGINPAMGWLFAVGLGLQEQKRAA